ncbi:hypothetical protein E4T56_gene6758 [Termitomyces sp. T112]|nr:hypothetical protein E4T56_gene6758 [Termitomyces sp. T112]KAH0584183.1 hypothetical protein H2248_009741 [Termitomyces sp. 'cryptogamus']
MDSREDFPRVSLATVNDWHTVKANYKSTVLDVLNELIQSHGLAAERDALLAHANQYVERVCKMARPNLRVNGHNFESLSQDEYDTEPFDEALDRRIWSLADTRLQWQKRIAETRRTLPREFERTVLDLFNQHRVVDGEAALHREVMEDIEQDDIDEILPGHSHIEDGFRKTVALGEELEQTAVSQEERAERARAAAGEVKALKP